jgi:hypothetical protein
LYAGTHDDGVFRLADNTWQALGLDHAIVSSILFVPGSTKRLLVGVMPYSDERTDAAVFASEGIGQMWQVWDGGLAARHDNRAWAYSLAMDPGNPDRLYAGLGFPVIRSDDGGRSWHFVWGSDGDVGGWAGVHATLVSPTRDGHVWAGGETALFTAAIIRSTDWGDTWEFVDPHPRLEGGIWALALDRRVQDRLFAGGSYGVMRSDDGGASWRYVLLARNLPIVMGLEYIGQTLYAVSQENTRPPPDGYGPPLTDLGLYRTRDGGETWDTLAVPHGAGGAEALVEDSGGRLLIGTRLGSGGSGVWRLEP